MLSSAGNGNPGRGCQVASSNMSPKELLSVQVAQGVLGAELEGSEPNGRTIGTKGGREEAQALQLSPGDGAFALVKGAVQGDGSRWAHTRAAECTPVHTRS